MNNVNNLAMMAGSNCGAGVLNPASAFSTAIVANNWRGLWIWWLRKFY